MNEATKRMLLGAVIPAAVAAVGLLPYLAYRSDLPDRVATHFGVSGRADGSMTPDAFLIVMGVLMALGLGGCAAMAVTRRELRVMVVPTLSFVGAFIGTLGAGILASTAIGQRGLERWQDATLAPWALLVMIAGSLVVGGAAARLASSLPNRVAAGEAGRSPSMDLASGERAFWSATLSARWPLWLCVVALVAAVGLGRLTDLLWIVVAALLLLGLVGTALSRIRVTVDRSGLTVLYGFLGWPRTRIPVRRIEAARAIDLRPGDWGGWGYRGSLALMRRAAVVLRAGPGLRVDLNDGKVFAVTIDDPETAARLLNGEIARLASPTTPLGERS